MVGQVRAARQQYGCDADIRVITFYNMQKRDLEREFKSQADLRNVRVASVSKCLIYSDEKNRNYPVSNTFVSRQR